MPAGNATISSGQAQGNAANSALPSGNAAISNGSAATSPDSPLPSGNAAPATGSFSSIPSAGNGVGQGNLPATGNNRGDAYLLPDSDFKSGTGSNGGTSPAKDAQRASGDVTVGTDQKAGDPLLPKP